jgi:hypothetical protein
LFCLRLLATLKENLKEAQKACRVCNRGSCAMSGKQKGVMGLLGKIDLYKKFTDNTAEDFLKSTKTGVMLSIVSAAAMTLLFLLEFSTYMTPTYKTDIVVDEQVDAKMKVFFDFTIHDLPCKHAVIDVEDSLGLSKHNVSKHIIKVRLDSHGRNLGEHKDMVRRRRRRRRASGVRGLSGGASPRELGIGRPAVGCLREPRCCAWGGELVAKSVSPG